MLRLLLKARQPISGYTHLFGALAALISLWLAILPVAASRPPLNVTAFTIFCVTMFLVFFASAMYHLLPLDERGVAFLRRIDHSMIYIFIAGTYTPVCLIALREGPGVPMLMAVWTLACAGVAVKIFWLESSRWLRVGLYVALGVASVVILPALWYALPPPAFAGLIGGALIYLAGAIVYATKRPDPLPEVFGFHEIWHLFALSASAVHFWVLRAYLL